MRAACGRAEENIRSSYQLKLHFSLPHNGQLRDAEAREHSWHQRN